MHLKNPADRWGPVSQLLHWSIALLLVAISIIGLTMGDLPRGPQQIRIYTLHKSLGITILALVVLRLAWRAYAGAPAPAAGPRWQRRIASLTHAALYFMMFALPMSGWLLNSTTGYPLRWFNLVNLPHLTGRDEHLHEIAEQLHETGFWILLALVAAHVAATFYHQLFLHDGVLARMWPRRRALPETSR